MAGGGVVFYGARGLNVSIFIRANRNNCYNVEEFLKLNKSSLVSLSLETFHNWLKKYDVHLFGNYKFQDYFGKLSRELISIGINHLTVQNLKWSITHSQQPW